MRVKAECGRELDLMIAISLWRGTYSLTQNPSTPNQENKLYFQDAQVILY